ncbi:MAG: tRNA (adenosine(37)-N6)-threonylcarbamoyltransferase complex dimerization subunit type 1 TsaB [Gammaproteobacteria bacterium]|nr:MAG: tRNA (adenosine(37)-N6)-threonylcarbamoyltransferase complex dimerization subunit type 1 TsaB [Gammaproteobacteria bacterium]
MKLLAIDTSQEACSAAIQQDDELIYRESLAPREHTRLILPMVEELLMESGLKLRQLDALVFGCGPGSFTGLRIASGVIQGLALGADLPVISVSSLAALAHGVYREKLSRRVLCAFDARIEEVYWGAYQLKEGVMTLVDVEAVISPQQTYMPESDGWIAAGSAWAAYPEMQQRYQGKIKEVLSDRYPLARDCLPVAIDKYNKGELLSAEQALPVYLRTKVAQTTEERNKKL